MEKKKGTKSKKRRRLLLLEIGGVAVLAALAAGIVLYKNIFSDTRDTVLEEYMGYIEKQEYDKMYALLDTTSKDSIEKEDFVTRNKNIYEGIEAEKISLDIPEKQDVSQPLSYRVTMETLAGEIVYDANTFFEKEKGKWRIVWQDSMIFPDLGKDDKVS
ncbi:MAG: NTF2-like N-terminal transpeptidase domain-containing protein, partial [Blautia sp.]